eukprot:1024421-Heterocapsa_arctica.AAC.1
MASTGIDRSSSSTVEDEDETMMEDPSTDPIEGARFPLRRRDAREGRSHRRVYSGRLRGRSVQAFR